MSKIAVQKEMLTEDGKPIKKIKIANITIVIPDDCDIRFYQDEYVDDGKIDEEKVKEKSTIFDKIFRLFRGD